MYPRNCRIDFDQSTDEKRNKHNITVSLKWIESPVYSRTVMNVSVEDWNRYEHEHANAKQVKHKNHKG